MINAVTKRELSLCSNVLLFNLWFNGGISTLLHIKLCLQVMARTTAHGDLIIFEAPIWSRAKSNVFSELSKFVESATSLGLRLQV